MTSAAAGRRGRHDPWKAAFFGVAAIALVAGVLWALLGSSLFVVRSVQVGGGAVSEHRVLRAAKIALGTPLIRLDTAAIARRVARIRQVQSARVRRSWPDSVVISTVPRTPAFLVRTRRHYTIVDSYGVILGRSDSRRSGLVLLKKPADQPVTALRTSAAMRVEGAVVRGLPPWLRHRVAAVGAARSSRVMLRLRGGITVVWGDAAREAAKAEELAVLLRTEATYIDVSDPESAMTGQPAAARR
ncbi:MAG TPA: FtsQ-type POTRA domain-containing protein [Streptosporangiaceae bacterium]|nr:FtsQ-type POTRA domain-containing protein [Streptosporangiaceae bacterium]